MSLDGSSFLGSDHTVFEGLLAVRMGMIEHDIFQKALLIWQADPTRSMAAVLHELGHIDPKETELLDAASHILLDRHNGDVNQAIAAIGHPTTPNDPPGPIPTGTTAHEPGSPRPQNDLPNTDPGAPAPIHISTAGTPSHPGVPAQAGSDTNTAPTIDQPNPVAASPDARTISALPSSSPIDFTLKTSSQRTNGPPLIADRYEILNLHAKGNLGEVFRARDHQLGRDIALKRIQSRHADITERRDQFEVEARITGQLEHPGIVPVYSLGRQADGRPCYAMRLIRGQTLRHAISDLHRGAWSPEEAARDPVAANLAIRALIRRFIAVCESISYAHSRGVLHRDIKPSNIMLGEYGETLVVDWGLSKAVGTVDASSSSGSSEGPVTLDDAPTEASLPGVKGTIPYMSPEQARGEELDTRSDIYSLGGTLYSLLTGRLPYEGTDTQQMLDAVARAESRLPRSVRRDVPPALEAICVKAMASTPEGRYPSARALAEDLTRWIDDEPVHAYSEPWNERLGRWARHHQAAVGVTAATLAVAALASLPLGILYQRENQAKAAVVQANKNLTIANQEADRRFGETRSLVDEFTHLIDDNLLFLPGAENFRKIVVEKAADRYMAFLLDRPDDKTLMTQAAEVFRVAANSNRSLEQEGDAGGRTEQLYNRAHELYALLAKENDELTYRPALTLIDRGAWHYAEGRAKPAQRDQLAALAAVDAIPRDRRTNLGDRLVRGMARLNLAGYLADQGRYAEARDEAARAVEHFSPFTHEAGRPWPQQLLLLYARLSWLEAREQLEGDAFDDVELNRLLNDVSTLLTTQTRHFDVQYFYTTLHLHILYRAFENAKTREEIRNAADRYRADVRSIMNLYSLHPGIPFLRRSAAEATTRLAEMQLALNNPTSAGQNLAIALRYARVGSRPEDEAVLAAALDMEARFVQLMGQTKKARELFDEALMTYDTAIQARPHLARLKHERAKTLARLSTLATEP